MVWPSRTNKRGKLIKNVFNWLLQGRRKKNKKRRRKRKKKYTKLGDLRIKFLKFHVEGRGLEGGDWDYRLLWELDMANT